jgi:hypothetical protein
MDDLTAERLYPLDRDDEVCNREIRERETIARAGAALVQPNRDPLVLALPAASLLGRTFAECRFEQPLPKSTCAFGFVGGELDQEARRQR